MSKVCPIMAQGYWSGYLSRGSAPSTLQTEHLPKCLEEECGWWRDDKKCCSQKLRATVSVPTQRCMD